VSALNSLTLPPRSYRVRCEHHIYRFQVLDRGAAVAAVVDLGCRIRGDSTHSNEEKGVR
jgi:hypothetical protein